MQTFGTGSHSARPQQGDGRPRRRGRRGGRNRTRPAGASYPRTGFAGADVMNTDDIGDTVIVSGSDTPEDMGDRGSDITIQDGSFARPKYASDFARDSRSSRGQQSYSRGSASRGGARTPSHDSRSRAWSPERSPSRGRRDGGRFDRGGRRDNSFDSGRSNRGGGSRGGGRGRGRFNAPDIDIERFIEKSKREIEDQRAKGAETPVHVVTNDFASLITHPKLREQVVKKGYTTPTPIQDKAIPHVYQRKDVVGIANTGTGKTAAFLLPLIDRALVHANERTLIVVPTRELATQIWEEFQGFSRGLGMTAAVVIGGANIRPQISAVRTARFVIGTPGRLKDLIERRALDMQSFTAIVLDEADRMLDMGFIPDIRFLMERMHHERHSLCFSATMPPEIEKLINEFLKDPISVSTRTSTTSHAVEQGIVRITEGASKFGLLEELLRDPSFDKVIVFGATKRGVERLAKQLAQRGVRAESIHGNKSSNQRKRALDAFKSGRTRVLVATDVAARGLDISDVSHVINFDVPHTYEDYVHRIGRTGRGGATGKALTFVEGN